MLFYWIPNALHVLTAYFCLLCSYTSERERTMLLKKLWQDKVYALHHVLCQPPHMQDVGSVWSAHECSPSPKIQMQTERAREFHEFCELFANELWIFLLFFEFAFYQLKTSRPPPTTATFGIRMGQCVLVRSDKCHDKWHRIDSTECESFCISKSKFRELYDKFRDVIEDWSESSTTFRCVRACVCDWIECLLEFMERSDWCRVLNAIRVRVSMNGDMNFPMEIRPFPHWGWIERHSQPQPPSPHTITLLPTNYVNLHANRMKRFHSRMNSCSPSLVGRASHRMPSRCELVQCRNSRS